MTLRPHRRRDRRRCLGLRVWLNGVDVSARCFYADGRRGVVRLYRLDADGRKFFEGRRLAVEERRGRVRWVRA